MYTSLEQRMAQSYIGLSPSFRSICFRAQNPLDWILKRAPSFGVHDVETDGLS